MAEFANPSDKKRNEWRAWVAERPENVRVVAEKFPPWELFRLKTTDQRVVVGGFDEHDDGSVTLQVAVSSRFNFVVFERMVFGINPDDLEPCDLPKEGEIIGAVLTEDADVETFIEENREDILAGKTPELRIEGGRIVPTSR